LNDNKLHHIILKLVDLSFPKTFVQIVQSNFELKLVLFQIQIIQEALDF